MKNNEIKELYRDIKPSRELKEKCLTVKRKRSNTRVWSMVSAAACALIVASGFGVNSYFTPSVSAVTYFAPAVQARTETVVTLSVRTHTPVTIFVEEGQICVSGSEWTDSISLSTPSHVSWLVSDTAESPELTLTKGDGKTIVYHLSRTKTGDWKIVR